MIGLLRGGLRALCSALGDERGNIAVITALLLPVLVGGFGITFETAGWYQTQRNLQNAADSAAMAAATNGGSSYAAEADAVTASYGYTNGSNGVVVTASNTAACPSGGNTCYSVTITKPVPLYLLPILGFHGDATLNHGYAEQMTAAATAKQGGSIDSFCLIALNQNGNGITANGVPFANLNGCDVFSNANADCNGHNLNAGHGDAHDISVGCGMAQYSNLPVLPDSYAYLAADIPTDSCTGTTPGPRASAPWAAFETEPVHSKDPALSNVSNTALGATCTSGGVNVPTYWGWTPSGSQTLPSVVFAEGDVQLAGNWNVTTPAGGTTLVIVNGQLDTSDFTLQTQSGSGLTVIFTSDSAADDSNAKYTHAPTGNGTLDMAAPTSGTWSGVALYQDPNLTAGVDLSAAGNSPTWDISGLVYLPNSTVTLSGAVNKSSNGKSCFTMVTGQVTINGTGSIESQGQCTQAGLTQPSMLVGGRGQLVV